MPNEPQLTYKFKLAVDGSPVPVDVDDAVVSVVVDDNLNLPDLFLATFRDPVRDVLERSRIKIGSVVVVKVFSDDSPAGESLIEAEVTAVEAEYDAEGTLTVVRGYDHSHRLFRGRFTETYQNMTFSDIAGRVAQRAGLRSGRIDSTSQVHDHVSQVNQNDWTFLWRMAREVGYEVAVVEGKLDFRRPAESAGAPGRGNLSSQHPMELTYGANLLRLTAAVTSSEQVSQVEVRGWDMSAKEAVVGNAPARTLSADIGTTPDELAGLFGGPTYVGAGTPYTTQAEVDAAATATAEQIAGAFAELNGVARGNPKLRAGTAVSLSLVKDPFDGKYILTSTRHTYDPRRGYEVRFSASGRQERSLLGLTAGSADGTFHVEGVATALVTNVADPEDLGRVKLTFPWLAEDYESDWSRIASPGAGHDRGLVTLPEVNDEVLVAFDRGDMRRPFVVGGLWNGRDTPPLGDGLVDGSSGAITRRGFVSKLGSRLIFFDDASKDGIALHSSDEKLRISMNNSDVTIKITSEGKIEITGSEDVTVEGKNLQLKASQNLKIEAGMKLEMSGQQVSLDGKAAVAVTGKPIQLN